MIGVAGYDMADELAGLISKWVKKHAGPNSPHSPHEIATLAHEVVKQIANEQDLFRKHNEQLWSRVRDNER